MAGYNTMELMICVAARFIDNGSSVMVGTGAPCAAAMLAQKTCAPDVLVMFEAGGIARRIRVFRLPDENPHRHVTLERRIPLAGARDNALYVCLVQEDGHLVWSSPIYIFR